MFTDILGYKVFNKGMEDLMIEILTKEKVNIVSGNPEVLYNGMNNKMLDENFKDKNSIIIPDGVGTVIASKIVKQPVKEKIAGIEVMGKLLEVAENEKKSIYLLGAKKEVVELCAKKIKEKHPKIEIAGYHDGYFDVNDFSDIVIDVKRANPWAIFVAMGSPKQEQFIHEHFNELPCSIYMGVGGSFDIFAGNLKRAPKWMIKCGLEWLYRVLNEPFRIKRLGVIPKFLWKVIKEK